MDQLNIKKNIEVPIELILKAKHLIEIINKRINWKTTELILVETLIQELNNIIVENIETIKSKYNSVIDDKIYGYIHKTLLKNLEKTIKIFEKHNIKYWAIAGTLLGSIRECKIIEHDDDIDLGLLKEEFLKLQNNENNIINDLNNEGLHLLIKNPELNQNSIVSKRINNDYEKITQITNVIKDAINNAKETGLIDIMAIEKMDGKYFYAYDEHRSVWVNSWFYENELYPLKKGKLNNLKINIPNIPVKYLERVYGDCTGNDCWKIPKKTHNHINILNIPNKYFEKIYGYCNENDY